MRHVPKRRMMLGIGNRDRRDDAAGCIVAQQLHGLLPHDVEIAEHDGEATSLLARLDGLSTAVIVDACRSGAAAGTVHRFDINGAPMPQARFGLSSHSFGLDAALELARALGQLPARCIVYAIEGADFDVGRGLSAAAAAAIASVTPRVVAEFTGHEV